MALRADRAGPVARHLVPGAARHRHPTGARRAAARRRPRDLGSDDIPIERYTSRAWHELEVERLWKRVWQFACREEEIPEPGDHHVYEIADDVVPRRAHRDGRHQGLPERVPPPRPAAEGPRRPLQRAPVPVPRLRVAARRCAAGRAGAVGLPPRRRRRRSTSPRSRSARGRGFVFVNPDPARRAARGVRRRARRALRRRGTSASYYKEAHVARVLPANWKIAQEAFCEAFHVNATHPQVLAVPRRHEQPGRRLGELRPGRSRRAGRRARCSTGSRRQERDAAGDARRPRRRGAAGDDRRRADDAGRRGRDDAGPSGGRSSATASTPSPTPSSWTASTTRCSRTSTRGAR